MKKNILVYQATLVAIVASMATWLALPKMTQSTGDGSDPKPWPEIVLPVLASAPSVSC
jgi:hypothetical protein